MPTQTPLTKTPSPLLTDAANIETAVGPGLETLEKFSIPRFSSTAARNAAFAESPPAKGQLIYVQTLDHLGYQVWDGNDWEEFGEYTWMRPKFAIKENSQSTNNTNPRTLNGFDLRLTPGVWDFKAVLSHSAHNDGDRTDSTGIQYNVLKPSGQNFTATLLGRAEDAEGDRMNASHVNVTAPSGSSASFTVMRFGLRPDGSGGGGRDYARMEGLIVTTETGDVTLRFGRTGPSGGVTVYARSYMIAYRIG